MSDGNTIEDLLRSAHTIAVVGLSNKRWRPSYGVSEYMQRAGYRIIPVNPALSEVLGERCYPDVDSVPEPSDIVDIFRRSELVPEVVDAAIRVGAKAVWMQEGVVHEDSAARARAAGLVVVDGPVSVEGRIGISRCSVPAARLEHGSAGNR